MKFHSFLLYFFLFWTGFSQAQKEVSMSLSQILDKVFSENLDLKVSEQVFKEAQGDFRQTHALLLPSVRVSHTALTTTNPLMAFGFKLNQERLTPADFDPSLLNDPEQIETFATRVELMQPLLNLDGYMARAAAKLKMEAMELQSLRSREYMHLGVFQAFKQLELSYKMVSVYAKAKETAQAHYNLISDYVEQGLAQEADRLMVSVRLNEVSSGLAHAERLLVNASDRLFTLMNEPPVDRVILPVPTEAISEQRLEDSVELADRKDVQAMSKATQAYHKMFQSTNASLAPRLNAFANYELYDTELFQTAARGYTLGAQLSWDVFDGFKTAGKVQKAKAQYLQAQYKEKAYLNQSANELRAAERQAADAQNQLALAQLALEHAKEVYRIKENRFKEGLEKTTDLLLAETQYVEKELALEQAAFNAELANQFIFFLTR
jgi:outer membrane protein TolC